MGNKREFTKKVFKHTDKDLEEAIEIALVNNLLYDIPINLIDEPEFHDRTSKAGLKIESLAANISSVGLLQPIVVTKNKNGRYTRVSGYRRIEAFKLLRKEAIRSVVLELINKSDMHFAMLSENMQRVGLNAYDEVRTIVEIMSEDLKLSFENTISLISRISNYESGIVKSLNDDEMVQRNLIDGRLKDIGKYTFATFKNKLSLFNMHPDLISAIQNGVIDYTFAKELHRLKKFEEKMISLLNECKESNIKSSRELKQLIDTYLSSKLEKKNDAIIENSKIIARKIKGNYSLSFNEEVLNEEQKQLLSTFLNTFK